MLVLFRYVKGYYEIVLSGYSPERFMNLCRLNSIVLWDITHMEDVYICRISIWDYRRIDPFLQKTKVKAEIRKEYGLPFFVHKNRKRKIFFAGILLSFLFLYGMSFFVWSFSFSGNQTIEDAILLRFIHSHGVHYGSYRDGIDIPMLEKEIREYFDRISWVSVKLDGTKLVVALKENETFRDKTVTNVKERDDLICGMQGTIVKMITRKGVPLVKVGDEVEAGNVLVEGRVPIYDNDGNIISYDMVDADADVTIRTEYPMHRKISRYYRHKNYTGNEYTLPYIRLGQHYLGFFYPKNTYHLYDVTVNEKTHPVLEELSIPLYIGSRRYCEYVEIEDLYGEEEGKILLKQFLEKTMKELNEKGVQIIENNVKIESDSQYLRLTGSFVIDVLQQDN